jgi:hypothetical protein
MRSKLSLSRCVETLWSWLRLYEFRLLGLKVVPILMLSGTMLSERGFPPQLFTLTLPLCSWFDSASFLCGPGFYRALARIRARDANQEPSGEDGPLVKTPHVTPSPSQ